MLSHRILLPPTGWAGGCGVRCGIVVGPWAGGCGVRCGIVVGPCGGLNITQAHIAQGAVAVAEQHAVSHDSCHDGAQLRSINYAWSWGM